MLFIRSIFFILFIIFLHNHVYSQENSAVPAQSSNYKIYPLTRFMLTNGVDMCGYYDSLNNTLYSCQGQITKPRPDIVREKIPHSLCCSLNDTDSDGVNDDEDKCINEKGPVSNFGCPVTDLLEGILIHYPAMPTVFFANSSSYLSPKSIKDLQNTVKFLKEWPGLSVNLDGHSDNLGSDELNRSLCVARIKAVKYYLMKAGINKNRITDTVHGSIHPIDNPETEAGRAKNRRVEITTYKKSNDN